MFHKTFDNNLVAIPQSKVALKLNKPEYVGMWLLELSKAIMDELHHDYIKNSMTTNQNYYLQAVIV